MRQNLPSISAWSSFWLAPIEAAGAGIVGWGTP